ncbi:MAG: YfiR family protein [Bacteroidales bacterium]|nr:YfiR family protein [Bacteroidales bacterium]
MIKTIIDKKLTNSLLLKTFAILFICLHSLNLIAQKNVDEYVYKRALIYKIALNFIKWPSHSKVHNKNLPFVISIIGEDPFEGKLKELEHNKSLKINDKQIIVRNIHSIQEIEGSDILFISSSEKYDVSKIIQYTHGKPILTFGDTKGFAEKGVMILLFKRGEYIRFLINKKEADASGIYIGTQLLGRAEKVIR